MATKLTKGELMTAAANQGVDPDQSYENLRNAVSFGVCKQCGTEHLQKYSDKYCSDTCEVQYINENFK